MHWLKWLFVFAFLYGLTLAWMDAQTKASKQTDAQYIQLNRDDGTASIKLTTSSDGNWFLGKQKPRNGQCPVCGEMAPKHYAHSGLYSGVCLGTPAVDCQQTRITRCKRCNAAFWQDAEEVKK